MVGRKIGNVKFKILGILAVIFIFMGAKLAQEKITSRDVVNYEDPFAIHFSPLKVYWKNSKENIRRFPETAERIEEMGAQLVRLDLQWDTLEPRRGKYDWSLPDEILESFDGKDIKFHFRIFTNASWAVRGSSGNMLFKGTPRPNAPKDMKEYEEFLRQAVRRYKGKVKYWQIDNEIYNFGQFWAGTAKDYLDVLKAAYGAIKSEDPSALVLPAGIAFGIEDMSVLRKQWKGADASSKYGKGIAFLKLVLDEGRDYFDILDAHLYWKYEEMPGKIIFLKEAMRKLGYEKPVYITETGGPDIRAYLTNKEFSKLRSSSPDEIRKLAPRASNPEAKIIVLDKYEPERYEIAAQEVVKRYVVAFNAGASSVSWLRIYSLDDKSKGEVWWDKMGLMSINDSRRKEGFIAYRTMTSKLKGFTSVTELNSKGNAKAFRFQKGGDDVYVLWSESGANISRNLGWKEAVITDIYGNEKRLRIKDGNISLSLTSTPVFCERGDD